MSAPLVVRCRQYRHGGARFYTVDENGVERLLADTYDADATERVASALGAIVTRKEDG